MFYYKLIRNPGKQIFTLNLDSWGFYRFDQIPANPNVYFAQEVFKITLTHKKTKFISCVFCCRKQRLYSNTVQMHPKYRVHDRNSCDFWLFGLAIDSGVQISELCGQRMCKSTPQLDTLFISCALQHEQIDRAVQLGEVEGFFCPGKNTFGQFVVPTQWFTQFFTFSFLGRNKFHSVYRPQE